MLGGCITVAISALLIWIIWLKAEQYHGGLYQEYQKYGPVTPVDLASYKVMPYLWIEDAVSGKVELYDPKFVTV